MAEPRRALHFATRDQQALAARLGMWVFMGSESLLFAALFGLYAAYRSEYPAAFNLGMGLTAHTLGAIDTAVLLTSSLFAALAVEAVESGRRNAARALTILTIALGIAFLVLKGTEYAEHFREGMIFGGNTRFFIEHPARGLPVFVTLYYLMTGLHALHVTAGVVVLIWLVVALTRGRITTEVSHPFEIGVLYWHLVDMIWVFLWPMFYFSTGSGR